MGRNVSVMGVARQRLCCASASPCWAAAVLAEFLLVMMVTSRAAAAGNEGTYSFAGTVVDPQGKPVGGGESVV